MRREIISYGESKRIKMALIRLEMTQTRLAGLMGMSLVALNNRINRAANFPREEQDRLWEILRVIKSNGEKKENINE